MEVWARLLELSGQQPCSMFTLGESYKAVSLSRPFNLCFQICQPPLYNPSTRITQKTKSVCIQDDEYSCFLFRFLVRQLTKLGLDCHFLGQEVICGRGGGILLAPACYCHSTPQLDIISSYPLSLHAFCQLDIILQKCYLTLVDIISSYPLSLQAVCHTGHNIVEYKSDHSCVPSNVLGGRFATTYKSVHQFLKK